MVKRLAASLLVCYGLLNCDFLWKTFGLLIPLKILLTDQISAAFISVIYNCVIIVINTKFNKLKVKNGNNIKCYNGNCFFLVVITSDLISIYCINGNRSFILISSDVIYLISCLISVFSLSHDHNFFFCFVVYVIHIEKYNKALYNQLNYLF